MVRRRNRTNTPASTSNTPSGSISHAHNRPLDTPELDTIPEAGGRDAVAVGAVIEVSNEGLHNIENSSDNALINREEISVPTTTIRRPKQNKWVEQQKKIKKIQRKKRHARNARRARLNPILQQIVELAEEFGLHEFGARLLQMPHEPLQPIIDADIGPFGVDEIELLEDLAFDMQAPTAENNIQTIASNHIDEPYELSLSVYIRFIENMPTMHQLLNYKPRRALAHQFHNMDHQTVVLYGDDDLQICNLADNSIISEWKGTTYNVRIEQVVPTASSALALVTKDNQLSFLRFLWNSRQNHLYDMPLKLWEDNANANISIVESADMGTDNEFQFSLFAGAKSGGSVFRKTFNLIGSNVTWSNDDVSMETKHHGIVSALCHLKAKNHVVSGSTLGSISIHDYTTTQSVQEFDLGEDYTISSITACPSNPNLFMVGCCQPRSEMRIYDIRQRLNKNNHSLRLKDEKCTILSRYSRLAWNPRNSVVSAPACQIVDNSETAIVLAWDPRFVRCGAAQHIALGQNRRNAYSVDIVEPAAGNSQVMVTACEDALVTMPLYFGSVST